MATATASKKRASIKFRPLDDRVVVEPLEAEETTAGGIILPDTAKEKPQRGIIIGTGPGKMLKDGHRAAMEVKVGDQVFYGKYAGNELEYAGEKFVVLRETDLLGVVEG